MLPRTPARASGRGLPSPTSPAACMAERGGSFPTSCCSVYFPPFSLAAGWLCSRKPLSHMLLFLFRAKLCRLSIAPQTSDLFCTKPMSPPPFGGAVRRRKKAGAKKRPVKRRAAKKRPIKSRTTKRRAVKGRTPKKRTKKRTAKTGRARKRRTAKKTTTGTKKRRRKSGAGKRPAVRGSKDFQFYRDQAKALGIPLSRYDVTKTKEQLRAAISYRKTGKRRRRRG